MPNVSFAILGKFCPKSIHWKMSLRCNSLVSRTLIVILVMLIRDSDATKQTWFETALSWGLLMLQSKMLIFISFIPTHPHYHIVYSFELFCFLNFESVAVARLESSVLRLFCFDMNNISTSSMPIPVVSGMYKNTKKNATTVIPPYRKNTPINWSFTTANHYCIWSSLRSKIVLFAFNLM